MATTREWADKCAQGKHKPHTGKVNPNGFVLYEGPSELDGAPIVVIATGFKGRSRNRKIGTMIQTWIMRADMHPVEALSGADRSICGDCPHRKQQETGKRSCYVQVGRAPAAVWRCYQRGGYAPLPSADLLIGRTLRLGSYGDPAAVPADVWMPLLSRVVGHTGYTHQWRSPVGAWARGILQASCDGMADYLDATAHGWGTFHVAPKGTTMPKGVAHCAASKERGAKTTCEACLLCSGTAQVGIWQH
jgi:hypothetical protein